MFWLRTRIASVPAKRDVVLDCFFAGPAIAIALFLLFLTPAKLSWYFWLYRVDLLAMALVTIASGFVFLGYQQVLRSWQAFVLLFLAWPYPAVALQNAADGGSRHCISVNSAEPTREGSNARNAGLLTVADITRARLRAVADAVGGGLEER